MFTKRSGYPEDWCDTYCAGPLGRQKTLCQLRAALDICTSTMLLGLLTIAILGLKLGIKRRVVLFKPLLRSLILYATSQILSAIVNYNNITDGTVNMPFQLILQNFSYLFALCTIFFLLYWILSRFQERSTGRVSDGLVLFHGAILGLMGVICVAEFVIYVTYTVKTYYGNPRLRVSWHWIQCVRRIYLWLASLEIIIWALVVMVRTSRNDRNAKPLASYFLLASIGFFAMNLMWAIITIEYYSTFPRWLSYIEVIFPFPFILTTYYGIMMCGPHLAILEESDILSKDISSSPILPQQNPYMDTLEVESRPIITEADPSREF